MADSFVQGLESPTVVEQIPQSLRFLEFPRWAHHQTTLADAVERLCNTVADRLA